MKFNPNMATAPKDRTLLLDVGYPWPVVAHWNPVQEDWVCAELAAGIYRDESGRHYNDTYFENEHEKNPKGWALMPSIGY